MTEPEMESYIRAVGEEFVGLVREPEIREAHYIIEHRSCGKSFERNSFRIMLTFKDIANSQRYRGIVEITVEALFDDAILPPRRLAGYAYEYLKKLGPTYEGEQAAPIPIISDGTPA